jgi:hypothetical protein
MDPLLQSASTSVLREFVDLVRFSLTAASVVMLGQGTAGGDGGGEHEPGHDERAFAACSPIVLDEEGIGGDGGGECERTASPCAVVFSTPSSLDFGSRMVQPLIRARAGRAARAPGRSELPDWSVSCFQVRAKSCLAAAWKSPGLTCAFHLHLQCFVSKVGVFVHQVSSWGPLLLYAQVSGCAGVW